MGETMRTAIAFFMGLVLAVAGCTQTEPYVFEFLNKYTVKEEAK